MSDKEPYPDPVSFDHAAAQAALTELDTVIKQLTTYLGNDKTLRDKARDGWTGPHADLFNTSKTEGWQYIELGGGNLKSALQKLYKQIQQADSDATQIQKQHDAANAAWHKDHP